MTAIQTNTELIPFRMHPRVFSALGADLVTDDNVAIIELVKNSYDAMARNVHIRFKKDEAHGNILEIEDDGIGMSKEIIEDVWCIVGTPHKLENSIVNNAGVNRRVSGSKGLGRLSTARLGNSLQMITQTNDEICWEINIDWRQVAGGNDISDSFVSCKVHNDRTLFSNSGTLIRISELNSHWDNSKIRDLEENLTRLVSPFSNHSSFNISLSEWDDSDDEITNITPTEFLSDPKYQCFGEVDEFGNISGIYKFSNVGNETVKKKNIVISWEQIHSVNKFSEAEHSASYAKCGPFSFDIRVWDIAPEDTSEISEYYNIKKRAVLQAIRFHKGISVYRDDILILPKSDKARDWIGLDLRRVGRVGKRLSTNQIVGYVEITAELNSKIGDTSDRERFISCPELDEFIAILRTIIFEIEDERENDRIKKDAKLSLVNLFDEINADELTEKVAEVLESGNDFSSVIPLIEKHNNTIKTASEKLQKRFVYYSRLASIGTLAHMLIHEIRNQITVISNFLTHVKDIFTSSTDRKIRKRHSHSEESIQALDHLAEIFSPLANINYRGKKFEIILEEQISYCINLHVPELTSRNIKWHFPKSKTRVAVHPGDLCTILINLITNSIYWLSSVPKDERSLDFVVEKIEKNRVLVRVIDTGPGVEEDEIDAIFLPGVTKRPHGIGMGLTVASEIVAAYEGKLGVEVKEVGKGASFEFDIPLSEKESD